MSTPTTPDIGSVISSETARRIIYSVYVVVAFVIACIQVGYSAAQVANPIWLTVALAVVAYAALPIGGLAVANTSSQKRQAAALAAATTKTGSTANYVPPVVPVTIQGQPTTGNDTTVS